MPAPRCRQGTFATHRVTDWGNTYTLRSDSLRQRREEARHFHLLPKVLLPVKNILRKFTKALLWLVAIVFGILMLTVLALQLPFVQTKLTQKAAASLEAKIGTPVGVDAVRIGFPKNIVVKGFYVEDQQGDTLIYIRSLAIDTHLPSLLDKEIRLDHITLEGLVGNVYRARNDTAFNFTYILDALSDTASADTPEQQPWSFSIGSLLLRDHRIRFDDRRDGMLAGVQLGLFTLAIDSLDLDRSRYRIGQITLEDSFIALHLTNPSGATDTTSAANAGAATWDISLARLTLRNNALQYYDFTQPAVDDGIDFSHLWLTGINLDVQDILYQPDRIAAGIDAFTFRDKSGFRLGSMSGNVSIAEQNAAIRDLIVETSHSKLSVNLSAEYPSLAQLSDDYQLAHINADIKSTIGIPDLLLFQPHLDDSLPINIPPNTAVQVSAGLSGRTDNIRLNRLNVEALSESRLRATGTIKGLPDLKDLALEVNLDELRTTRRDLEPLLPDTLLADSIALPDWIALQGAYRGNLKTSTLRAHLTSNTGELVVAANMNLDSLSPASGITGQLDVRDLNIGYILGAPDSVLRTLSLRVEGGVSGLASGNIQAKMNAVINTFFYNGYTYENLNVQGILNDQRIRARLNMDDENLVFSAEAGYDFSDTIPRYTLAFDLVHADFQALHFSQDPIRARGQLSMDLSTKGFTIINGNAGLRKVAVFNGDELYSIDSLLFASVDEVGRSQIHIDSDLLTAKFEGSFNMLQMPSVMREYVHTYYQLHDTLGMTNTPSQTFDFLIQLRNTELLTELLIPELTEFVPGDIRGSFDSEKRILNLDIDLHKIQYGNIGIDSLRIRTDSDDTKLQLNLAIDQVMIDSMRIDGVGLAATLANDSMKTRLTILDSLNREKYILAGTFFSRDTGFDLTFSPQDILLNYLRWTVPPDNYVRFGGDKPIAENVEFAHGTERILFRSTPDPSDPITVGFRSLNLEHFGSIVAERELVSGTLNGNVHLYPRQDQGQAFAAGLGIEELAVKGVRWGDIRLDVEHQTNNRFDVDFLLSGDKNEIAVNGFYDAGESVAMSLDASIRHLALATLQPLLAPQVADLTGFLQGEFSVTGNPQQPNLNGDLTFSNVAFRSTTLNTSFSLNDESIHFSDRGIEFDNFEVVDERQNTARLNGAILTRNYRDFRFSLDLNVTDFRLLNTDEGDHELFYGQVDLNAFARIRGDLSTPVVDLDIGLSEGSHLTYIVPQAEAAALQTEGIVKFVDKTFESDPFMARIDGELADTVKSAFTGLDLTARVELTEEERFSVIIDPLTGDQLTVRGDANLTLTIDPTGDMNLTGRYEVAEGTYNFTFYKFVKREFQIEPGGSITWMGDPLNAQLDLRAIFNVETAPIDLLANQLTGADASQTNPYRQRMPFQVYLGLSGDLLQPEINFELDMPPESRGAFNGIVYARLQDINTRESDLNKQVFALLILKRFISDDPFESQGGGGLATTARRSVSKVLSDQLNRLSQNVKGVELSFDIKSYEDYSGSTAEGQTELQLGVSKSLFDERLVVKLSGNVDVEGRNSNRQATDYIGDLALEYKVTPDGRFRITGFRNSNYDMIDGELIETGAGLIYIKDYNALSELFKANAAANE